jgi:hypothetical protein
MNSKMEKSEVVAWHLGLLEHEPPTHQPSVEYEELKVQLLEKMFVSLKMRICQLDCQVVDAGKRTRSFEWMKMGYLVIGTFWRVN